MGRAYALSEKGTEEMETMTLVKDGRDWRVSVDGGWTVENGALVLSHKQVVMLVDTLTYNPVNDLEQEDG